MLVFVYDRYRIEYEINCERWENDKDGRYVFYNDRNKIVAVFQKDAIVGFSVKNIVSLK